MAHLIVVFALLFGALVAPAAENPTEILVRAKDGTTISAKLPAIAGKVTLLPGNVTLVEGQPLRLTTLVVGAPHMVRFFVDFAELQLGRDVVKSTTASGAVVVEYQEEIVLPPGEHKILVVCENHRGNFFDKITVRVIGKLPMVEIGNKEGSDVQQDE